MSKKPLLSLPLLPACAAGSLPKQTELVELRYRVSKGIHQNSELERKEKLSTEVWIRQQEKLGLDVLVDGEMDRGDMVHYFSLRIDGFEEGGTVRCYGNRYYRRPVVKRKLEWKGGLISEGWKYAQRLTHKPVKAVLTGAYSLMEWSFNEFYDSREELCRDLTAILKKEVQNLVDGGAKIIQFDELALPAGRSDFAMARESIEEITRDIKAYFILRFGFGDLAAVWPSMRKLPVDNFHLEMANSGFAGLPLLKKYPTNKDISIGVIDSHNRTIETPRQLSDVVKKVLKAVPLKNLWLSTDAGLKTRTIDEAIGKLKALSQTAAKYRPR